MVLHGAFSHVRVGRVHVCLPTACTIGLVSACRKNSQVLVFGVSIFVRQVSNIVYYPQGGIFHILSNSQR